MNMWKSDNFISKAKVILAKVYVQAVCIRSYVWVFFPQKF